LKPVASSDLVLVNQPEGNTKPLSEIAFLRAYSELAGRSPEYPARYVALLDQLDHVGSSDPYVQAALAHRALEEGKNEEALAHLATAVKLGEAAVYEDMGKVLANLDRGDEAVNAFVRGMEVDPYRSELRKNLILEYIKLKRYTEARHAMEEYVGLFPEDDFMRRLLARVPN